MALTMTAHKPVHALAIWLAVLATVTLPGPARAIDAESGVYPGRFVVNGVGVVPALPLRANGQTYIPFRLARRQPVVVLFSAQCAVSSLDPWDGYYALAAPVFDDGPLPATPLAESQFCESDASPGLEGFSRASLRFVKVLPAGLHHLRIYAFPGSGGRGVDYYFSNMTTVILK
jgi:hypothetical protein